MAETRANVALETVIGDGLHFVVTNAHGLSHALDSGPGSTAPSPMDALLGALGGCSGMDVISVLRKKRQVVTGYAIELIGKRHDEHPRAYTSIEVVHKLRGKELSAAAVEEAIRLSDTKYCSVHATLMPGVAITSRFEILADDADDS